MGVSWETVCALSREKILEEKLEKFWRPLLKKENRHPWCISTEEIHNGERRHDVKLLTPRIIQEKMSFLRDSWPKQPGFWYKPSRLPALGRGSHWESQWPEPVVLEKLSWWQLGGWEPSCLPVWPVRVSNSRKRGSTGLVRVSSSWKRASIGGWKWLGGLVPVMAFQDQGVWSP